MADRLRLLSQAHKPCHEQRQVAAWLLQDKVLRDRAVGHWLPVSNLRSGGILLAVGLADALLSVGCDTAQQTAGCPAA